MRFSVLLLCSSLLLFGQTSAETPEKGVLAGKVLNSVTGEPMRKAHVALISMADRPKGKQASPSPASTVTDAVGSFEFTALAPGSYRVDAFREGFVSPNGRKPSWLPHLTLASGEEKRDIVIRLMPLGVITGRILDEDGDPIRGVQVQAMVYQYTAAGRQLAPRGSGMSDDLGAYRIYEVQPGRYYLRAGTMGMMHYGGLGRESYAGSYYPGTPDATEASTIEVGAGLTLEGINLTLRRTRAANIRGRVMNPGKNLTVGLMQEGGGYRTDVNDPDGKFELQGVPPGSYILTAASTVGGRNYSARLPIQAGATDLEGIELHLIPPMEIAGQIRVEGKTSAKLSGLRVELESEGQGVSAAGGGTKEDGSFAFEDLPPAVYYVRAFLPEDLYLRAVRWSDRDVMQSGIDLTQGAAESKLVVVLSANGGQIDGVVEDDQSAPAVEAMVTLVPLSGTPSRSLFKFALTSPTGHFHMQGIAPGSYKLFAWEAVDINELMYDPDFLKPFDSQAQSIEISESSRKSVQLKLIKQ
jgi:protocatechuate 3,4-dioxygenase beta subunit